MIIQIWISQIILAIVAAIPGTELLPERYLKPRDFNYHPFTDVGVPASLKKASILTNNPYAILSKLRPREGRDFPSVNDNIIIYPTPHPSVLPKKHIETNEITNHDDPLASLPKNYAFMYTVKDHLSGDDFSHSQAHNGKATKGEYRVKLPDGRTQIVSYTADHKGYRADVQYEDNVVEKSVIHSTIQSTQSVPETPAKLPEIFPKTYHKYQQGFAAKHIPPLHDNPEISSYQTISITEKPETTNHSPIPNIFVSQQLHPENFIKLIVNHNETSSINPQYYRSNIYPKLPSPPAHYKQNYYPSPILPANYLPGHFISSTPLYPINHISTTPASPIYDAYQNQQSVSSTTPHQHTVVVTPRPIFSPAAQRSYHSSLYGLK